MSQSIRISDELMEAARRQAKLFFRSPSQQIEYWVAIGRVMEVGLSYPAQEKVAQAVSQKQLDEVLADVGTAEGIARAQKVIQSSSARIVNDH